MVQLAIPPCAGPSRRKRLCSSRERNIARNYHHPRREISREFRWKFYLFQPWARLAQIYICIYISRSFHVCRFHPRYHYRIYPFWVFSGCRDTQHHAADDKREGGLYVRAAERHRCDTVRRVRQSNPHEQVRTSNQRDIRIYEFVTLFPSVLVNFGEWRNLSETDGRLTTTLDPRARFSKA